MKQKLRQFLLSLLIVSVLGFAGEYFVAWWMIALVAVVSHFFFRLSSFLAFLSGFIAIFILWSALALYIHHETNGLLTLKMSALLGLNGNGTGLILLSAAVGGLVAGFSALTGNYFRKLVDNY